MTISSVYDPRKQNIYVDDVLVNGYDCGGKIILDFLPENKVKVTLNLLCSSPFLKKVNLIVGNKYKLKTDMDCINNFTVMDAELQPYDIVFTTAISPIQLTFIGKLGE